MVRNLSLVIKRGYFNAAPVNMDLLTLIFKILKRKIRL